MYYVDVKPILFRLNAHTGLLDCSRGSSLGYKWGRSSTWLYLNLYPDPPEMRPNVQSVRVIGGIPSSYSTSTCNLLWDPRHRQGSLDGVDLCTCQLNLVAVAQCIQANKSLFVKSLFGFLAICIKTDHFWLGAKAKFLSNSIIWS